MFEGGGGPQYLHSFTFLTKIDVIESVASSNIIILYPAEIYQGLCKPASTSLSIYSLCTSFLLLHIFFHPSLRAAAGSLCGFLLL